MGVAQMVERRETSACTAVQRAIDWAREKACVLEVSFFGWNKVSMNPQITFSSLAVMRRMLAGRRAQVRPSAIGSHWHVTLDGIDFECFDNAPVTGEQVL